MVGIRGLVLTPEERELLQDPRIGGVLLFARNHESVEQLRSLTGSIHTLRRPPLLIAVDQEGGCVQRLRTGFTALPSPVCIGRIYDRDRNQGANAAEALGWLMAAELRAAGVDLSFAPVLDVECGISRVIGERAFHHQPEAVAELALAWVRGVGRAGMAAVGKHFPGHGAVAADSHHELPVDTRSFEAIEHFDLLPFRRLIAAGLEGIMTAHVLYPQVDGSPASFSGFWITKVLRKTLGFTGAVISDDLGMQGAAGLGGMKERMRAALAAGCDLLVLGNELEGIASELHAVQIVERPVLSGRLATLRGRAGDECLPLQRDPRWQEAAALAARLVEASQE